MLLPTKAALTGAIKKAHFQCIVWYNDTVTYPNILEPPEYGWKEEAGDSLL